jgi:hypothetical protein
VFEKNYLLGKRRAGHRSAPFWCSAKDTTKDLIYISMKVEILPITSITPYARNPRLNTGIPVAKVKASLKEFGWQQPIVVDKDRVIVVGHTRYAAALELGMNEVPVHVADCLTPTQIKAYRIADNKTATFSGWDMDLLELEFDDLKAEEFDLDLTGFDADELAGIDLNSESENTPTSSSKEIDPDDYQMSCRCPRCGFEFDDKKA